VIFQERFFWDKRWKVGFNKKGDATLGILPAIIICLLQGWNAS